jgi:hypothetical protein
MFNRWAICEAYYLYALNAYVDYTEACKIRYRLKKLGYNARAYLNSTEVEHETKAAYGRVLKSRNPAIVARGRLKKRLRKKPETRLTVKEFAKATLAYL